MKTTLLALSAALVLGSVSIDASAKGCLKGAAVGAVAGHVAGHHAVVGAVAGCVAGRHLAKKKDEAARQAAAANQAPAPAVVK
jgi:hypothetical protein